MNCRVVPLAVDGFAGVTAIDDKVAAVTVRIVDPVTPPRVAEMVEVPTPTALERPWLPAAFEIVAAGVLDDAHVTVVVRFCVEASE